MYRGPCKCCLYIDASLFACWSQRARVDQKDSECEERMNSPFHFLVWVDGGGGLK
jgi:hypothetical protein